MKSCRIFRMRLGLFAIWLITVLAISEKAAAADSNTKHSDSYFTTRTKLLDLQNNINSLTASRLFTLIVEKVQLILSMSASEPSSPPPINWSSFGSILLRELFTGLKNRAFCGACYVVANVFKLLSPIQGIEEIIAAVSVEICIRVIGLPQYVCEGHVYSRYSAGTRALIIVFVEGVGIAVGAFRCTNCNSCNLCRRMQKTLYYVARHTPYSSSSICSSFIGFGCEGTNDISWQVQFPMPKPPVKTPELPKEGSPTLTVLHLTDAHIDRFYAEGSSADCGLPFCCREDSPASLSGVTAGPWGAYGRCDIPLRTLYSMLDNINATLKPDLVVFTGDVPAHDIWATTRSENLYLIDVITDILQRYFPEAVFMAVGNHESAPVDTFPPASVTGYYSNDWLYEKFVTVWGKWLPESTYSTIRKGGFYSAPAKKGLRIIAINSDFGAVYNFWLVANYTDPMDQLQWLIGELQKAEDIGEKVLLLSHYSPGNYEMIAVWSKNFYNIINRYENTIIALLAGHTHYDHFEILYDESGSEKRPTRVTYISPSITSAADLNLAYRTFTLDGVYDGSSFEVLDHTTYFADLTTGNMNNASLSWKKLYSAKEFYVLESLQASEWDKLVTRMKDTDELFQDFYSLYSRKSSAFPACDDYCKESMLCALKCGRSRDLNMCNV